MANAASPPPPTMTAKSLAQREAMTELLATAGEGGAVQFQQPTSGTGSPSSLQIEKKTDAAQPPTAIAQDKESVIASRKPCQTAKAQENKEFGAGIAAFGASMIVVWSFLSPDNRGAHNMRYIIPMFLSFACFASGVSLMFLSMNILGLPENVVADSKRLLLNGSPSCAA